MKNTFLIYSAFNEIWLFYPSLFKNSVFEFFRFVSPGISEWIFILFVRLLNLKLFL